jgi:lipoate-protein ligase A
MELYNLGKVPWETSQLAYHALARLGREALCLVSPASPYVCIGYHQDAAREVDMDFCRANRIPVFRREVGGGAVYLDGDQLFFQLVLRKENPAIPRAKEAFYRKFLGPVVDVYRKIGISAEYKPINDVIAGSRKISGTGVGEMADCIVFVGNLILDFNFDMMCRILRVPDEKFRDKIHKTLTANLTTIRQELGAERAAAWSEEKLNGMIVEEFSRILGPMQPRDMDSAVRTEMSALGKVMLGDAWLMETAGRGPRHDMRIRSGVHLAQRVHKAEGGLIRADFEIRDEKLAHVAISGDFFCYPPQAVRLLESELEGKKIEEIRNVIDDFYLRHAAEIPGVGPDDWLAVFTGR